MIITEIYEKKLFVIELLYILSYQSVISIINFSNAPVHIAGQISERI